MGGAIGAGGLGDVAIRKGYQGYNFNYLLVTSIILIVFVQIIQTIGNYLFKKLS
jgi:D-methionine transport system permease protein